MTPQAELNRKIRSQNRWRWAFFIGVIAWCLLIVVSDSEGQTIEWREEPNVYFNNAVFPQTTVPAIEYALWSIKQRTGKSGVYAGLTDKPSALNAIVVQWVDSVKMQSLTGCQDCAGYANWWWDGEGFLTGSEIYLNSDHIKTQKEVYWVVLHEMGHAFGQHIHHEEAFGVFYLYRLWPYDYALTMTDMLKLPSSATSYCHAELTTEGDIYIPLAQGQSGMLRHNGDHTWTLAYLRPNTHAYQCDVATMDGSGTVTITDLRGIDVSYTHVVLSPVSNDKWSLLSAQ